MTNYRRNRTPGGTYFLTINLQDRRTHLLTDHIPLIRDAVKKIRHERPFQIDAWVILPDHMHCLWTLPEHDTDYSTRVRLIKSIISRAIPAGEPQTPSRSTRKERGIWQRRFWEHTIRDDRDFATHMDYIHFNPVHHGLTKAATNWPYSTFKQAVARGLYPADWSSAPSTAIAAGEPT